MMQPPETATVERWCWNYVLTTDLQHKLAPPAVPQRWETTPIERRLPLPARPSELQVLTRAGKSPRRGALQHAARRAEMIHTFLHHELQAAELFAWAQLAFPDTPTEFRRGLLAIGLEEIKHLQLYHGYLRNAGVAFGDYPVRDWFWERVPRCQTPAQFVAVMGMGLEGGNLDHAARYQQWFADAKDTAAIAILETVRREEVGHVRFGTHWFQRFTGNDDFEAWRAHLPDPLSPHLMHGAQMNVEDRRSAGLSAEFMEKLSRW